MLLAGGAMPPANYDGSGALSGFALANNKRATGTAARAPRNCARMNAGTWDGEMPAKVSDKERAMVIAGFANEVDEVNQ